MNAQPYHARLAEELQIREDRRVFGTDHLNEESELLVLIAVHALGPANLACYRYLWISALESMTLLIAGDFVVYGFATPV
jgi:hypothetical protein